MSSIYAKAEEIDRVVRHATCPFKGETLFNPMRLMFEDGEIKTATQSSTKTAFVQGVASAGKVQGGDEVVLDADEFRGFLDLYPPDEDLSISFGDKVTIEGRKRKATLYPEALSPRIPSTIPDVVEGVVKFQSGPATTKVRLQASELSGLIDDARTVEVSEFPLQFSATSGSEVALGSTEPQHNEIEVKIDAEVEGEDAGTLIGEDFAFLFNNLEGDVELQLSDGHPLVVFSRKEWGRWMYVLTPRRPD